jgi:hypothetical protein
MVLLEGVFFDARKLSKLPYQRSLVWRVMKALVAAGVIVRVRRGKYIVADGFADMLRREVTWKMPRGALVSFPSLRVFDISGVGSWNEDELEVYITWLRRHWMSLQLPDSGKRVPEK